MHMFFNFFSNLTVRFPALELTVVLSFAFRAVKLTGSPTLCRTKIFTMEKTTKGLTPLNELAISHDNLLKPFNRRCRLYSFFTFFISMYHITHISILKIKCDIKQQDLKIVHVHFVKSE